MRILIIGAGLGGLTLLHGLRAGGLDAHVFERSARDGAQPASYGIHLNADGLSALHASLPAENWAMVDRAGVPAPDVIRFWDPRGHVLATVDKRLPAHATDPVTRRRAVSRGRLRAALLQGLIPQRETGGVEPVVHWGARFTRYERRGDGVRAWFEDGSHADGDLLVGADGSNSRVRHQRLPELKRLDLGILNVAGRAPLTAALAAALPADLTDGGINNVVPAGSGWLFCSTWDTGDPDQTDLSEGAGRYLVWAWAGRRDSYPDDVDQLEGRALKRLVQARIQGWSPPLRALIEQTADEAVSSVPLRSMPPLPGWTPEPVTLLGDAIHNMTPMAGIGANTALRDADQLRRVLLRGRSSVTAAVGDYETAMRGYANQALALSTRNARNATFASPANRRAFRVLLRVSDRVRPLKTRMFGPVATRRV